MEYVKRLESMLCKRKSHSDAILQTDSDYNELQAEMGCEVDASRVCELVNHELECSDPTLRIHKRDYDTRFPFVHEHVHDMPCPLLLDTIIEILHRPKIPRYAHLLSVFLSGAYCYLHFCLKNCLISIAHRFRHVPFSIYVFLHIHKVEYGMCIH
jgi:hypothetical protein